MQGNARTGALALPLAELGRGDVARVGGKNASLDRRNHGFDHMKVALSVGVQRMVRADKAGAGVMFSIDTETGFPRTVLIDAAWGLGETVVQGMVEPDEYHVFKPLLENAALRPIVGKRLGAKARKMVGRKLVTTRTKEREAFVLSDDEVLQLARWACAIEAHYGQPMDMEWAKDGGSGELFVVQARPETVESRKAAGKLRAFRLGKTGLCGQAPSTHPEFAAFLVAHGIDSISVTPDSFLAVKRVVARAEGGGPP